MDDEGTLVEHEPHDGEMTRSLSPLPPVGTLSPGAAARRIRFRTITLTRTGGYSERILSLDPSSHALLLQPLDGMQSRSAPGAVASMDHALWLNSTSSALSSDGQSDTAEQRFPLGEIATVMCFDDALAHPSAALVASGSLAPTAFSARALIIFHQDLRQRPHELLFQDTAQRNIFVAILGELYGIEIVPADDPALTSPNMLGSRSQPSLPTVKWIPDADVSNCMLCSAAFTLMFRKHHCRSCQLKMETHARSSEAMDVPRSVFLTQFHIDFFCVCLCISLCRWRYFLRTLQRSDGVAAGSGPQQAAARVRQLLPRDL